MSVPVALLLDAGETLTAAGVGFSGRKLAHFGEEASFDEDGFNAINFEDVYHHGFPGDRIREIHDRRTAEVVVPERLDLSRCLKFVICRTIYDERTLRYLVDPQQNQLTSRIRAAPNPTEFFFCWGTFIQLLEFSGDRLRIKLFQGRNYKADTKVRYQIWQSCAGKPTRTADFEGYVNNEGVSVGHFHDDPDSIWKILIEDVLAFHGTLPYQKSEIIPPSADRR